MKDSLEMMNRRLEAIRKNERASISGEIHENLGQSLTAPKIDIQHLRNNMPENSPEVRKLETMNKLVSYMIRDVQRIAAELLPAIIDALGLFAAIEWYIREFGKRTGISCRHGLDFIQFSDIPKNLPMYRILQEADTYHRHWHNTFSFQRLTANRVCPMTNFQQGSLRLCICSKGESR